MRLESYLLPVFFWRDLSAKVARVVNDLELAKDVDIWRTIHFGGFDAI
jgi:hypothetical protein